MRILRVSVENVGGIVDCDLTLPAGQLLAVAGANGTGKSKLLACLLFPWTRQLPPPRDPSGPTRLELDLEFSETELDVLQEWDSQAGWNQGRPPATVTMSVTHHVLSGTIITTAPPNLNTVIIFGQTAQVLKTCPSLDLLFLPAERRLLTPSQAGFDLAQLSDDVAVAQNAQGRSTVQNYGRLDDQEFENYAKALCVAGSLQSEDGGFGTDAPTRWEQFKESVDRLLHPKVLLPLTQQHPSNLRIRLTDGSTHAVHELSSGERQGLIILGRVFRAGEGHSLLAIDEPDAYLHPSLSARLMQALVPGLGDTGRLLVATHSPHILDSIPSDSIIRLAHDAPPQIVESESERLALYREAGFRASSLTQSDLLVVTEGEFDAQVLPKILPQLASASIRAAGGRSAVVRTISTLAVFDFPIIGIVDADVLASQPGSSVPEQLHTWPAADIEAVLLRSREFLECAIEGELVLPAFRSLPSLRAVCNQLLLDRHDEAVAEYAQRLLRKEMEVEWPSSKGDGGLDRLRLMEEQHVELSVEMIEGAISRAEEAWRLSLPEPWTMVRGKRILGPFTTKVTNFKNSDAFVFAVLARTPAVPDVLELQTVIEVARSKAAQA
jgi:energy-coupling factor transporter ATP-binding protein EcfA2